MSLQLSRNIVFEKEVFYDDKVKLTGEIEIDGAKWNVPDKPYIASNLEILSESPYFGNLNDKKINFIHLHKTLHSDDTKINLERTMSSIVKAMLLALQSAHKLYWLVTDDDPKKSIRSEFTLEYCLLQGMRLAQQQLQILNIIDETYLPKSIISIHAEDQFNDMIKDRKKDTGVDIAYALNNKPSKPKRTYKKKSEK